MTLDLHDLLPLWEKKLAHRLYKAEADRVVRRDVDFAVPPDREDLGGNRRTFTQDLVSAMIIRQRRIQR